MKDKITALFELRDNFIAHLSPKNISINFNLSDAEDLLNLAQSIYKKLNLSLYGIDISWGFQKAEAGHTFLEELSKFASIRELIRSNQISGNKYLEIKKLLVVINTTPFSY